MVGVNTTWGTELNSCSIRPAESHCSKGTLSALPKPSNLRKAPSKYYYIEGYSFTVGSGEAQTVHHISVFMAHLSDIGWDTSNMSRDNQRFVHLRKHMGKNKHSRTPFKCFSKRKKVKFHPQNSICRTGMHTGVRHRPHEKTAVLFALHALYHSPVTVLPHRRKSGFEDHWTLNLLNTSRLWEHLCTETLCWATMEFSVQSPTTLLIYMFSCMFSSTIKETNF